jgi:AGZA family xanthine/uracil permease-like MFS transporter
MLEKLFRLKENGTSVRREIVAGCTTFATLSYIIFVQPALLGHKDVGMNPGAVMVATCLASAGSTFLMAFLTNYPVALAPGMGINAYFVFSVCLGLGVPWQEALGIVFISGMLFVILSFVGLRAAVMNALPSSLHNAIAVGIGVFIAFIGLQMSGIIESHPATFVTLGNIHSKLVIIAIFGIFIILTLMAHRVKGAILMGILATTVLSLLLGIVQFKGVVSAPPSLAPTFLKLSFPDIFSRVELIPIIFVFFSVDMFDSIGTLTATGHEADLLEDGKLSKGRQALLTDAIGSVGGACLGTSTVTCYIESASGIAEGGRTGLTSIITGLLMLLALFFTPIIQIVGSGYDANPGDPTNPILYPIIGPALIVVGGLLLKDLVNINWDDFTEAIPAALTVVMMPLSFSITEGIAFGFISISFLKIVTGRHKELNPLVHYFAVFFVARYIGFA